MIELKKEIERLTSLVHGADADADADPQ
jgi:hypothetical protein